MDPNASYRARRGQDTLASDGGGKRCKQWRGKRIACLPRVARHTKNECFLRLAIHAGTNLTRNRFREYQEAQCRRLDN
jgi:hypothetical protein